MTTPLVTVLTAAHNAERYLPETMASITAQTFDDWEYIVVDDASTDGTGALVDAAAAKDARIRRIRRESSGGPYVAANDGLREARGTYVVRIDADDIAVPVRIERQVAFLRQHPDLRACTSWWTVLGVRGKIGRFPTASVPVFKWAACVASGLVHSTACVERAALEELGGYAELRASADYGMWCDLARRHWLGVVPEVLLHWRRHEEQLSENRFDLQHQLCIDLLIEHMHAMTGETWTREGAEALWAPGRWEPVSLRPGFASLDRWDRAWRKDKTLAAGDRRELYALSARVRARLVKWQHGRDVAGLGRGLATWAAAWVR